MKRLLIFFCLCSGFHSFSQSADQLSWYKMLTGKIKDYPIIMHLHKTGHQFSGYYYYDLQQPIYFVGEDTTQAGRIKLNSFASPEETEEFNFTITSNGALGSWKKDEKKETLPFTATDTTAPVSFSYVFTKGSAILRPKIKNSPQAIYDAASIWPAGTSRADAFLKTVIGKTFSKSYLENEEIGKFFLREKKNYLAMYLDQNKNVKEADIKDATPMYTMASSQQLMIAYQSPKLLTLAFLNYSFTGGAHGNHATQYASLDLVNFKKLKLQDIVTAKGQKALGRLLEKNFRAAHNLKPTESFQEAGLFENTILPNDNFFVTQKGLGFHYNPYEIGPYVLGEITIFIQAKDLQEYLQPAFKNLIH